MIVKEIEDKDGKTKQSRKALQQYYFIRIVPKNLAAENECRWSFTMYLTDFTSQDHSI